MTERTLPSVLIVDDDRFMRAAVRDSLEGAGYRIDEARNGDEALARIRAEAPSLVILDLLMPERSGLDVLLRMRELAPTTRVLVVSSLDHDGVVSQALRSGAIGFVAKPFHPLELAQAARNALALQA